MKTKIAILIIIMLIAGAFWFYKQNTSKNTQIKTVVQTTPAQNDSPKIVSTKPDPLENTIVSANEIIEITFNRTLENKGEFKLRIEPKTDFKIELSSDRKTAKIIPVNPYELGKTYTIFIGTETKFDGVGRWGQEKIYHFKTVAYRGV